METVTVSPETIWNAMGFLTIGEEVAGYGQGDDALEASSTGSSWCPVSAQGHCETQASTCLSKSGCVTESSWCVTKGGCVPALGL